ncbi:glycoside hydrolase [Pseudomassariella vexata]|uniref:Glycoside hydrolase n=1 Tax=Pseudomassariella vexata TaxID=1141098 RepID=A0A1Y2E2J2_9PEZI|nr:glycoside hydrolase [Pseudomassariella vexata]ORY65536.1 glycoside hydrolase [Pseudomassariella vexata]
MSPSRFKLCFAGLLSLVGVAAVDNIATGNTTADTTHLQTWWHDHGEINYKTPVSAENVRQSHLYSVWVKSTADSTNTYYNSFVYETIPRNGQEKVVIPGSSITGGPYDSVTIEASLWMTMGWTQFLHNEDAWVKISRGDNSTTARDVVIRPTNLNLTVTDDGEGNIYILVPYREQGLRFSVEFKDNLYSYRDSCETPLCDFVQDWHSDGPHYVETLDETTNPVMGEEPHDALLIFASPFPSSDLIPDKTATDTYVVYPGPVPDLGSIKNSVVYFTPGTYYMTATAHAKLSSSVNWVYLASGAYVKGAIQFTTAATTIKATGHGVLSGEQYVYQANTLLGYTNVKSNIASLRMWSGYSKSGVQQTFVITGVTTNAPPFNSIDFSGDLDTISINQWDYKQVGAFFGQTDGTTLYSGSNVHDIFYHSNDDTIKTYGSNILVRDVVIWKGKTAPIVQFGWQSRDLANITVDGVDVVHMKYSSNTSHPSIVGANQVYGVDETWTNTADLSKTVRDMYIGNVRAEGIGGNLLRICPLANYQNVVIENVSLDRVSPRTNGIYQSEMPVFKNWLGKSVDIKGFVIRGFTVGGEKITQKAGNYGPDALGGLNIADELLQSGSVVIE